MHLYTQLALCSFFLALLPQAQAGLYSSLFKKQDEFNTSTIGLSGAGSQDPGREKGFSELPTTTWRSSSKRMDNGGEHGVGTVGATERGPLPSVPTTSSERPTEAIHRPTEVPRGPTTTVQKFPESSSSSANIDFSSTQTPIRLPASTIVQTSTVATTSTATTTTTAATTTFTTTVATTTTAGSTTTSARTVYKLSTSGGRAVKTTKVPTTTPKPLEGGNGTGTAAPPAKGFGNGKYGTGNRVWTKFVSSSTFTFRLGRLQRNLRRRDERTKSLEDKMMFSQRISQQERRTTLDHSIYIRKEKKKLDEITALLWKGGIFGLSVAQGQITILVLAFSSLAIWLVVGTFYGLAWLDVGLSTGRWLPTPEPEPAAAPSPPPPSSETPPPTYEEVTQPPVEGEEVVRGAEALPRQPTSFTLGEEPLRHPLQRTESVRRRWGLAPLQDETQL